MVFNNSLSVSSHLFLEKKFTIVKFCSKQNDNVHESEGQKYANWEFLSIFVSIKGYLLKLFDYSNYYEHKWISL